MPRIRNWKEHNFYRSSPDEKYPHIEELFSATTDWNVIETMAPDMLRVAVSIKTGAVLLSDTFAVWGATAGRIAHIMPSANSAG